MVTTFCAVALVSPKESRSTLGVFLKHYGVTMEGTSKPMESRFDPPLFVKCGFGEYEEISTRGRRWVRCRSCLWEGRDPSPREMLCEIVPQIMSTSKGQKNKMTSEIARQTVAARVYYIEKTGWKINLIGEPRNSENGAYTHEMRLAGRGGSALVAEQV